MHKIRCIIIEDEPLAAKVLTDYINQVPFLEWQGSFKDALAAIDFLGQHATDLIFLDIHLPKLKGLDFLKTLTAPPAIIITTAYHQYAVEGFTLNVADYLLKPIEFDRFLAAVNKVQAFQNRLPSPESRERNFIFLTVQKRKVRVLFSDILYVESQKEYVKIVTTAEVLFPRMSTHEIESLLPGDQFARIHRSYIVAKDKILAYTAESVEIPGVTLPVGRAYKEMLERL